MDQQYEVHYTEDAEAMLAEIQDKRIQKKLADLVDSLTDSPEAKGKPLLKDLFGFRSVRAVGQRYRIVYSVDAATLQVTVVGLGIRKEGDREDVYAKVRRLGADLKAAAVRALPKGRRKPS